MTVAEMQTELDAMLDPLDTPGMWTQRERDTYETRRRVLEANIRAVAVAESEIADLTPQAEHLGRWCVQCHEWLTTFAERRAACPAQPQTRVQEYERLGLDISIRCLRYGFDFANEMYPPDLPLFAAMTEAGYRAPTYAPTNVWAGGLGVLPEAERRYKELGERLDAAERRLARALRDEVVVG